MSRPHTRETKQRRVIYETIRSTLSHPTADWIFEQVKATMPRISLGTVYRNLSVLKEEGMVREIYGNDRRAHYDGDTSCHAHFICEECSRIIDVRGIDEIDWRTLKDLVGCEVTGQSVEFNGLCAACSLDSAKH
ncbi:MAG: transcriptional repressor [Thermoanaerobaculales bacterium]